MRPRSPQFDGCQQGSGWPVYARPSVRGREPAQEADRMNVQFAAPPQGVGQVGVNHVMLDGFDEIDIFAEGQKLTSLKEVHAALGNGA